jgi:hypothetical protein|tara:strand:+ start:737 stop:961 length:225 start_codon:yes stop_codon:yes gene_type:complete
VGKHRISYRRDLPNDLRKELFMSKSKTYPSPVQPLWINDYFKEGIAEYEARERDKRAAKELEEMFENIGGGVAD